MNTKKYNANTAMGEVTKLTESVELAEAFDKISKRICAYVWHPVVVCLLRNRIADVCYFLRYCNQTFYIGLDWCVFDVIFTTKTTIEFIQLLINLFSIWNLTIVFYKNKHESYSRMCSTIVYIVLASGIGYITAKLSRLKLV